MREYVIFTDSCSDLGKDMRERMGIEYLQMRVIHNGEDLPATLDWDAYSVEELYGWLKANHEVKTNLIPITEFINKWRPVLEQGKDILYIACSSALSGSISVSLLAREQLLEEFPDAKIICVDSLAGSMTEGMVAYMTAVQQQAGKSIEEAAEWIEANKLKCNQFATVETLNYLAKSGRIKTSKAFFGNLFKVKPIFISDAHGNNYTVGKAKGRKASMEVLVKGIVDTIENPSESIVFIGHANDFEAAEYLKQRIIEEVNPKEIYVNYIGPIVGVTCGPGTIATFCFGKEVTVYSEE